MIEAFFTRFSKVSVIAVISLGFGSLLMFLIGAVKVVRAYQGYFGAVAETGIPLGAANLSIAYLVQAIDAFLIVLALMIFGSGIYSLFVSNRIGDENSASNPFRISNLSELKRILADMIIIILMVKFLESALVSSDGLRWEALILPGSIILLAGAVRILKLEH